MSITPHGMPTGAAARFAHMHPFTDDDAATHSQAGLKAVAAEMLLPADPQDPKDGKDDEENLYVPAGYTYLGQFVDHDLTFDTISNFNVPSSFSHAADMRTPRFDLDCVYGRGPDDQPYMYSDDGKLLMGADLVNGVPDVARNAFGRAIIGDPRNDENSIVVQLQSVFIRFHNRMMNRALAGDGTAALTGSDAFAWARKRVQHHYQRLLLDDYLPRIVDTGCSTVKPVFAALHDRKQPPFRLFDTASGPYMPLEFSAAGYRFGHSMVRPGYRLAIEAVGEKTKLFPVFQPDGGGLTGFRKLDPARGIDWRLFFHPKLAAGVALSGQDLADNQADANKANRTQFAYKIDTMLVNPIGHLPPAIAATIPNLAERNLLRGLGFKLPSGQRVAKAVNAPILPDASIAVRKAGNFAADQRKPLTAFGAEFAGSAPLWVYVLAEAEQAVIDGVKAGHDPALIGTRLTGAGAAIVVETFVGLMLADPDSVLNAPDQFVSINRAPTFSMAELLTDIGAF